MRYAPAVQLVCVYERSHKYVETKKKNILVDHVDFQYVLEATNWPELLE